MSASYIPATDAGFDAWSDNFASLLTADPTAYGEDAPTALIVQNAYDDWAAAYNLAIEPSTRTPVTVTDKDAERVTLDAIVRPIAQRINARPSVSNLQRTALGITVRKTTRTPVPPPATAPTLALRSMIPGVATLSIRDEATPTSKAKPLGAIGAEMWVAVGATTTPSVDDASLVKVTTKTPNSLAFTSGQAGLVATVWCRWQTRSGPGGVAQVGPWSAPITFTIA